MSTQMQQRSSTALDGEVIAPKTSTRSQRDRKWRIKVTIGQVTAIVLILAIWQLVSGRLIATFLISSPTGVAKDFVDLIQTKTMWQDILTTSQELVLGYGIGVIFGIAVGVLMGSVKFLSDVFEPIIAGINGIPKIALAPLFLLWFGLGIWSKVAQASMIVFFVMYYNVYMGMLSISPMLVKLFQVMGAKRGYVARKVVLPSLSVPIFAGLKASVPFAMIGVIVGEFIAADRGVGYFVLQATQQFDSAGLFSGILVMVAMVLIGMGIVGFAQKRVLYWQKVGNGR
ncbi:MAG: ABC transporter permease [Actinobacteria bacterium]|jgi:NitT/TauT family transport system permease protein|nr:ABC transporter permease [Actinomycetota bacterium]